MLPGGNLDAEFLGIQVFCESRGKWNAKNVDFVQLSCNCET
jgi:hypothetical protein